MGIQDFGTMDPNASLKQVIDSLADLMDTLNFLLNGNLDVKNVRAKSITADRMNVQQLSAIAADLGKVVAGILIGAYISTADGTYPRIDFSSSGNLLQAFTDANNYISMIPNSSGNPTLQFKSGSLSEVLMFNSVAIFAINSLIGNMQVYAQSGDLTLKAGTGKSVKLDDWDRLYSVGHNTNLQQELNSKLSGLTGASGTVYVSSTSGGPADVPIFFSSGQRIT